MRMFLGLDVYYFILVIPAFLFSLWAQASIKSTFARYSKVGNQHGLTGAQVARRILDINGLREVQVLKVAGNLTDHYDPTSRVVRLSESVHDSSSLAAVGVAAHETGHAIQHQQGYKPLTLRSTLYPLANIGSSFGPTLAIIGLVMNFSFLAQLGIILFAVAVAFYLITLPVEINASTRAIGILRADNILVGEEVGAAKKVLTAAAMTYVASAAVALANLIRFILISRRRD